MTEFALPRRPPLQPESQTRTKRDTATIVEIGRAHD